MNALTHPIEIVVQSTPASAPEFVGRIREHGAPAARDLAAWLTVHLIGSELLQRQRYLVVPALVAEALNSRCVSLETSMRRVGLPLQRVTDVGLSFPTGAPPADISGFGPRAVDERVRWLRVAAGKRFPQLELSAVVQRVIVTDDRRAAAEQLLSGESGHSVAALLACPFFLFGTVEQFVEQIRRYRDRWGISYYTTFEPQVDALAPVVAALAGT